MGLSVGRAASLHRRACGSQGTQKPRGALGPGQGLRLVTHGHPVGDQLTCQSLELSSLTSVQRRKLVSKLLPNECLYRNMSITHTVS